jgi:hypothetical protein
MTRRYEDDEIGGRDPLDRDRTAPPPDGLRARLARRLRTTAMLGLAPALAPAMLFVPLGALLGPAGINLLNLTVVSRLGPVVSVGLATLGVFVGLALSRRPGRTNRLLLAASVESATTILVVFATTGLLVTIWQMPVGLPPLLLALLLSVCAAASSAGYEDTRPGSVPSLAARIANLDDVLPIVAGGLALASLHGSAPQHAAMLLVATVGLGTLVGAIGALLIERAHSEAERGVFVIGSLAFAGGASTFLGLSPLLTGLAAGVVWNWGPGNVDAIVRQDVRRYQHPLVVLLLIAAGASVRPSIAALWLCAPFVLFRVTGKIVGGWLASRFAPSIAPSDLGAHLLAPGLIGIAFALGAAQSMPASDAAPFITAVVAGTLVSELIALTVAPTATIDVRPEREPA